MAHLLAWIEKLNWHIVILLCIMPGLAPFTPPHLFEKLVMLVRGDLVRPLDGLDLVFHGLPWMLAMVKLCLVFPRR